MHKSCETIESEVSSDVIPVGQMEGGLPTVNDSSSEFKKSELGMIPKDWNVIQIGSSNPFVTSGSRGWARFYSESGSTFLRITNLSRRSIQMNLEDLKYVALPSEGFAETERTGVQNGDLLISITADIGIVGYVDDSVPKPAFLNQHIALVRFNPAKVSGKFAAYYLASEQPQRHFLASMDIGAKAGMNLTTIKKLQLALPRLDEQCAIATALTDADGLIEALDRLIAKKRAIKKAAMQQLLTGKTRLPGFDLKWKKTRLGNHVIFLKTGTNSRAELTQGDTVSYLHYGDIHGASLVQLDASSLAMPRLPDAKASSLPRLQTGDLVFVDASEDLDGVGKSIEISAIPSGGLVAGLHTIAARFDKAILADGFKGFLQFCPAFLNTLRRLAAGTKVLATNRRHIEEVEMLLPSTEEQSSIAKVLSDMDVEIEALKRRRDKAQQIKRGMVQQLMTGRIRLMKAVESQNI